MSITAVPTKEYSISINHLELDFTTDDGNAPTKAEQQAITEEQRTLPLVITTDASSNKDEIWDEVAEVITARSGWCVSAMEIDWYASGVDAVDVSCLTQEQMGELYSMLHFYTRKCKDAFMEGHNQAIDDFISKKLGLDDLDNQLFDLIDEKIEFDFNISSFDVALHHQQQREAWEKSMANS